ncbi:MAG: FGGY-family carbohydrate kinase, partial [Eubacteriales bacterium]|nr:FGGY-family carbohydrate kinase [Eubacteriales bacterium]
LDVTARDWSKEVLDKLDIDPALLPKVYESPEITGCVTEEAAALTGLAAGTIVVGGAADNMAAAVGMGVVKKDRAFTTIGTSGVVFAHSDTVTIDPKGRVHTFCHAVPGCYTVMSCTLAAGLSLKWLRDTIFMEEHKAAEAAGKDVYPIITAEAEKLPIGSDRLIFLPYLMGERSPILDENSRGAFIGLSAIHTKYHMLRAVMEGVSFSQRACLDVLRGMHVTADDMLVCGGGGKSPFWRQMLADIYGCPVSTISASEGPALGVAILAGVGAGLYESVESACDAMIKKNTRQEPVAENSKAYEPFYKLYTTLYPALKDAYATLATL